MILYNHNRVLRFQGNEANIFLMGLCGSAKTTVGLHLAQILGLGFLDLDRWVEVAEQKKISAIFTHFGESRFRVLESEAVSQLKTIKNHVIALGGGAVLDKRNWEIIRRKGTTVWLNPSLDEIAKRLIRTTEDLAKRPLFADLLDQSYSEVSLKAAVVERLSKQADERFLRYREAQLICNDSYLTPSEMSRWIALRLTAKNATRERKKGRAGKQVRLGR